MWANSKHVRWRVVANFVVSLRGVPFCVMDSICSCVMNPAWMAKHSTVLARPKMQSAIDRGVSASLSMFRWVGSSGLVVNFVGWRTRMLSVIISPTLCGHPCDR